MKDTSDSALPNNSDKDFWHRYTSLYRSALADLGHKPRILEFGVFKGDSVRWLIDKWPQSTVYAADILPVQPEWPQADNVTYLYVDQGHVHTIEEVFQTTGSELDLIIEDGSHAPHHQKNCLVEGLQHLRSGGTYILEDIHTSHPKNKAYRKKGTNYIGVLHLLMCIEHCLAIGREPTTDLVKQLYHRSLFTCEEITMLFDSIATVEIFKRATLPKKCYKCGTSDFNFHKLRCDCGVDLYETADSMTAVITVR